MSSKDEQSLDAAVAEVTAAARVSGKPDINELQDVRAALARQDRAPLPIGVLLSGSGTNLQAHNDAIDAGALNAEIKLVVGSRPSAFGLKRAEAAGIQTLTLSKEIYADPIQADEVIAHELLAAGCEYVVMAGYMRMVHAPLLATFPNRVINIHPALLPSFQGAHGIQDAFDRGVKVTGVTVHIANAVYDMGPIIAQRALVVHGIQDAFDRGVKVTGVTVHIANAVYDMGPIIAQRALVVEEDWDVDTLEEHIHAIEHVLYPEVVQMLADGRVHVRENLTVEVRSLA